MTPLLLLAYTPFLDPLPIDAYWLWLLPPIAVAIAIVYKTIKLDSLTHLTRHVIYLSAQILVFMAVAAAALWVISEAV